MSKKGLLTIIWMTPDSLIRVNHPEPRDRQEFLRSAFIRGSINIFIDTGLLTDPCKYICYTHMRAGGLRMEFKEDVPQRDWQYHIIKEGLLESEVLECLSVALEVEKARYVLEGLNDTWGKNFTDLARMSIEKGL